MSSRVHISSRVYGQYCNLSSILIHPALAQHDEAVHCTGRVLYVSPFHLAMNEAEQEEKSGTGARQAKTGQDPSFQRVGSISLSHSIHRRP